VPAAAVKIAGAIGRLGGQRTPILEVGVTPPLDHRAGSASSPLSATSVRPRELLHIDVKTLGRIQGGAGKRISGVRRHWPPTRTDADGARRRQFGSEYVPVAIDDATRLAYVECSTTRRPAPQSDSASRGQALRPHGVTIARVITDNGCPMSRPRTRSPAERSSSATSARAPTIRRPTAKPNGSQATDRSLTRPEQPPRLLHPGRSRYSPVAISVAISRSFLSGVRCNTQSRMVVTSGFRAIIIRSLRRPRFSISRVFVLRCST